jgi:putative IMPACT (imprinted ancient) family translation regulator
MTQGRRTAGRRFKYKAEHVCLALRIKLKNIKNQEMTHDKKTIEGNGGAGFNHRRHDQPG